MEWAFKCPKSIFADVLIQEEVHWYSAKYKDSFVFVFELSAWAAGEAMSFLPTAAILEAEEKETQNNVGAGIRSSNFPIKKELN